VKRLLKVPSDEQPTAKQTSVTLRPPRRSSAIARSMRHVIRSLFPSEMEALAARLESARAAALADRERTQGGPAVVALGERAGR
jgi:hypothetical protein